MNGGAIMDNESMMALSKQLEVEFDSLVEIVWFQEP